MRNTSIRAKNRSIWNLSSGQRLAGLAQRRGKTLSETIVQLIEDAENKEKYANKMSSLKQDLQALLGKE